MKNFIGNHFELLAKDRANEIDIILEERISETEKLSMMPILKEAVRESNRAYTGKDEDEIKNTFLEIDNEWIGSKGANETASKIFNNDLSVFLKEYINKQGGKYGEIFLTDAKGATVAMTKILSDYYQADEDWWKKTFNNGRGKVFIDDRGYDESAGALVVGITVPIREKREVTGILKVNYKVGEFLDIVQKTHIEKSDHIVLIRSQGEILAHTKKMEHGDLTDIEKSILKNNESGWVEDEHPDGKSIMGFAPVNTEIFTRVPTPGERKGIFGEKWEPTIWYLFIEVPQQKAFAAIVGLKHTFLITGFLITIIVTLLVFFFSKSISDPIQKLTKDVKIIGSGNLEHKIFIKSRDEIGQLSRAFNEMTSSLNKSYKDLQKENTERKLAEEKLKKARNELEIRVQERTAELLETNITLNEQMNERNRAEAALGERVKEINCLYSISLLEQKEDITIDKLLSETVNLIPPAWQYPEITHGRITFEERKYINKGFKESQWNQTADIIAYDKKIGMVEVFYEEEKPHEYEGAFLKEERNLINDIASRLSDVLKRMKAEKKIREIKESYDRIIDNADEAIFKVKADGGQVLYANPAAERQLGYSQAEYSADHTLAFKIIHPDFIEKQKQIIKEINATKKTIKNVALSWIAKDGHEVIVEHTIIPILDKWGKVIYFESIGRDITERKRMEWEQRKLEAQLLHSQKMEAIGSLANGIAHDFNNLLHSILGFASLLKKRFEPSMKEQRFIENIMVAVKRGKDLIEHLLAFSRHDKTEKKPTDIRRIVKETLGILRPTIPSTIKVESHIDHRPCYIFANPSQIHQVLMNICVNAAQAMQEGGVLRIELYSSNECNELKKDNCGFILPCARFIISDTGTGIDESIQSRVFEPFFTTKPVEQGSGLGLSVVYGIVKNHGGKITFSSTPGKGTTFYICFPLTDKRDISKKSAIQSKIPIGHKRVLFVDDEKLVVEMVSESLEELGFEVTSFTNSIKAFEAFSEAPDQFNVVITDLTMPDLTGLQLAKKIKSIRKDIPVLLCTGYIHKNNQGEIKEAGISELLNKPIIIDDMVLAIGRSLPKKKRGVKI